MTITYYVMTKSEKRKKFKIQKIIMIRKIGKFCVLVKSENSVSAM
jgi:hypothetical protein